MENLNIQESNRLIAEFMGVPIRKSLGYGVKVRITDQYHPYFGDVGTFVTQQGGDVSVNLGHSCRWVDDWGVEVVDYEPTLLYDKDWNALMPVVGKIESLEMKGTECTHSDEEAEVYWLFSVEIQNNQCQIHRDCLPQYYGTDTDFLKLYNCRHYENKTPKITVCYNSIIGFIKWYNLNNK